MPPRSKKTIAPKKTAERKSKASEDVSASDSDDVPIAQKTPNRRSSGRQPVVETPKSTRSSRSSQKATDSGKRKRLSRGNSSSSSSESGEEMNTALSKTPQKKRQSNGSSENNGSSSSSKAVRVNHLKGYEVEKIVEHEGDGSARLYRIRWKGYGADSDTWEPKSKLDCSKLLAKYFLENPDAKRKINRKPKKVSRKKKKIEPKPRAMKIDEQPGYDSEDNDENADWEVEKIIDVRFHRDKSREFLIRWKGYSSKSDTWEPEEHLNCDDLIEKFMEKLQKVSVGEPKELRENRQVTQRYTLMTQSSARRLSKRNNNKQRAVYYEAEL